MEGLRSKAVDDQGSVNLASLSKYVRDNVRKDASLSGHQQQPILRYEGPGPENWVLAESSGSVVKQETELERLLRENAELKARNEELERELKALKGE